ncbi:MAG: zinc ribbon domain-containing protein [Anaerolineae bacterium]
MPEISIDFVAILDRLSQFLEVAALCFGAFMAAFWISLVVWTFRDIRSRTHDVFFQLLSILLVLVFNVLGLFLYLILRPKETLAERYERALAEEALLQDIEERLVCPSCGVRVESDYLLCPACQARLKQHCEACGRLNELAWEVCPYCGHINLPAEDIHVEESLEAEGGTEPTEQIFGPPIAAEEPEEPEEAPETTMVAESDPQTIT